MLAWMLRGLIGLICIGSVVYLAARVRRFGPILRLSKKRRALSWLIGFALVLIPTAALCLLWTPLNMAVCLLHLTLFWLLSDLVFALIRRLRHAAFKRYWAGLAALILSVAWLSMGWVQANCVWRKDYTISTDKEVGSLRVALGKRGYPSSAHSECSDFQMANLTDISTFSHADRLIYAFARDKIRLFQESNCQMAVFQCLAVRWL